MQKPLEILYEEFAQRLVETVNESGLPPFIVSQCLRSVLSEVDYLVKQHYEQAKEKYNESEVADG